MEDSNRTLGESGFQNLDLNQKLLSDLCNDRLLDSATVVPSQSNTPQFDVEQPLNAVDIQKSLLKHQEQIQQEIKQQQLQAEKDLNNSEQEAWQAFKVGGYPNNGWSDHQLNSSMQLQGNMVQGFPIQALQPPIQNASVAQSLSHQMKQNQVAQQQAMMEFNSDLTLNQQAVMQQQFQDALNQQHSIQEAFNQQALHQEARKQQQALQDALQQEAMKQQVMQQEAMKQQQEVLKQQAIQQEAMKQEAIKQQQALHAQQEAQKQQSLQQSLLNMNPTNLDVLQQEILMNPIQVSPPKVQATPVQMKEEAKPNPHNSIHNPFVGVDSLQKPKMNSILVQPLQPAQDSNQSHRRSGSQSIPPITTDQPNLALHLLQQKGSLNADLPNSPHSPFVNTDPLLSVFSTSNQTPQSMDTQVNDTDRSGEIEALQQKLSETQKDLEICKRNLDMTQHMMQQQIMTMQEEHEKAKKEYEETIAKLKEANSSNAQELASVKQQLDKVNAYVAKRVVDQATNDELEKKMVKAEQQLSSSFNDTSGTSPQVKPISVSVPAPNSSPNLTLNVSRPASSAATQPSLLTHQLKQATAAPPLTHDTLMQPQPIINLNLAPMLNTVGQQGSLPLSSNNQNTNMVGSVPMNMNSLSSFPYLNQMSSGQVPPLPNMMSQTQSYYPVVPQNVGQSIHMHSVPQSIPIPNPNSIQPQAVPMQSQPVQIPNQPQMTQAIPQTMTLQNIFEMNVQKPPLPQTSVMGSPPVDNPPFKKQKQNPLSEKEVDWSVNDNLKLSEAIEEFGQNWMEIKNKYFPSKSAEQVEQHWASIQPRKGKWSKEEDEKLLHAYGLIVEQDSSNGVAPNTTQTLFWCKVAAYIPGRSGAQCLARYSETLDPSVKKGKWSPEEDKLLAVGFETHGKSWVKVASMIPGRTQRQCRTRWVQLNKDDKEEKKVAVPEVVPEENSPDSFDDSDAYDEEDFE